MSLETIRSYYELPLFELLTQAGVVHNKHHDRNKVKLCELISIKTGGCPEDCKYCAQSARYNTNVKATPSMRLDEVVDAARKAIERGATRICLGAGQREVRSNASFEEVLEMVKAICAMGVEVCCTLGMLKKEHAQKLFEAGLYAYNHNLDTSERYYPTIITTRTYGERLKTLSLAAEAGLSVCCGGIIGMGETSEDRLSLLHTLSQLPTPPESVPINLLSPIAGTPLQDQPPVPIWELIRLIATTRLVLPKAMIRLSAGREQLSYEQQALCILSGANSFFIGERLLTVGNTPIDRDQKMLKLFGLCG